jgi:type I restriction enzyme S subunit
MSESLPNGWTTAPIGCLADLQLGKMLDRQKNVEGTIGPYLRNINVRWFEFDLSSLAEMRFKPSEIEKFSIRDGDVLICEGGEPGRAAVWRHGPTSLKFQKAIHRARCGPGLLPEWLALFLRCIAQNGSLEDFFTGTTIKHLPGEALARIPMPVPPFAEQRRIVNRIEALFGAVREARKDLDRTLVLAQQLMERAVEAAYSPDEDNGWKWEAAGTVADIRSGITLGKRYPEGTKLVERPYLRVANVQRGYLDLRKVKSVMVTEAEDTRLALEVGDILMNEGGDRDKLGRGWIWQGEIQNCIHQNHVFRLRLRTSKVTPIFVSRYANHFGQRYFMDEGKQTTNLASISRSKLSAFPVPVPPPGEAERIDQRLTEMDKNLRTVRKDVERTAELLDRLDRRILDAAFRGDLVPQDADDEPAEETLARLRQEVEAPAGPRGRQRRHAA